MTEATQKAPGQPVAERETRSQWRDVWDQFTKHKGALIGGILFFAIVFAVMLGPSLWPYEANEINIRLRNQNPSWAHPFGTDQLGRDTFARMIAGGQTSITVGLAAMMLSLMLGSLIGVLSGYYRRLDGVLMRFTDLFLSLPLLPLLLVMMLLFREPLSEAYGPERGMFVLIVVSIGITSWMPTARIVRGDVLALKEREFILAARSIGTSDLRIILRHILPNVLSPILVSATLGIANAIITESALSFLGLGFPPDFPTWGRLLNDAVDYMQLHPERVLWPGLAISLTVLSINYLGDGLRDAMDPRIRGR
ncbi:MAG: peptide ABC transporter [SAR116 cluster bacterium]|nr:peptide ABC transporter [SAR116 cluster bacterium]MEC8660942.1 ABC transporter permease [Pseudomonadota bacterium]